MSGRSPTRHAQPLFVAEVARTSVAAVLAAMMMRPAQAALLDPELHGFLDLRGGVRTQSDPAEDTETLGEVRLQFDAMQYTDRATVQLRADFLYDGIEDDHDIDLETGAGWIDLREANILVSPVPVADMKIGRQILTWGTGDLVFINDLFPKDWVSFFSGRDEEYLKAPSDALFVSLFPPAVNIDIAYTPRFDPDRYLDGERISFFGGGQDAPVHADVPGDWFDDQEIALRLSRTLGGIELAGYGYHGFWKSPAGMDAGSGRALFPALDVIGASARGQLGPGIANFETGYYQSSDDESGKDPLVRNSEARALLGYQRELARDLSATAQYYLEFMMDHDDYARSLPEGAPPTDEDRHVVTLRLTRQLMSQNLTLSVFGFYSPSDKDGYLRPGVSYKVTDAWLLTAGGNAWFGDDDHTFFGQFEDNSNLYAGARYSF